MRKKRPERCEAPGRDDARGRGRLRRESPSGVAAMLGVTTVDVATQGICMYGSEVHFEPPFVALSRLHRPDDEAADVRATACRVALRPGRAACEAPSTRAMDRA